MSIFYSEMIILNIQLSSPELLSHYIRALLSDSHRFVKGLLTRNTSGAVPANPRSHTDVSQNSSRRRSWYDQEQRKSLVLCHLEFQEPVGKFFSFVRVH